MVFFLRSNFHQVASTSHRLLSLLAEGLCQGFHPYFRSILGAMLVKLKDKKCVGVLGTCLDKVYGNPYSLDQVRIRGCFPACRDGELYANCLTLNYFTGLWIERQFSLCAQRYARVTDSVFLYTAGAE